jgi:hypothetical protein
VRLPGPGALRAAPRPGLRPQPVEPRVRQPSRTPSTLARVEPRPETRVQPLPQVRAEPRSDLKPEPRAEPKLQPRQEPKPEARVEPRADPRPQVTPEARPLQRVEPRPEPIPVPRVEPRLEPKQEPVPLTRPDVRPETAAAPKVETPLPRAEARPEPAPVRRSEPRRSRNVNCPAAGLEPSAAPVAAPRVDAPRRPRAQPQVTAKGTAGWQALRVSSPRSKPPARCRARCTRLSRWPRRPQPRAEPRLRRVRAAGSLEPKAQPKYEAGAERPTPLAAPPEPPGPPTSAGAAPANPLLKPLRRRQS